MGSDMKIKQITYILHNFWVTVFSIQKIRHLLTSTPKVSFLVRIKLTTFLKKQIHSKCKDQSTKGPLPKKKSTKGKTNAIQVKVTQSYQEQSTI